MLAFLLAAGSGSRLRPITDSVPKCLVPIGGRPLIAYNLDLLSRHGITKVVVNGHHLHQKIADYLAATQFPFEVILTYEPTLLGSAGTLHANRKLADGAEDFFVLYADNLTNANLSQLGAQHRRTRSLATIGLFEAPVPSACGIVTLNADRLVAHFEEKPHRPRSNLAFAGLLIASRALLDQIPDTIPCDLARDVLPNLVGQIHGWRVEGYLRDIGTLASYQQAERELPLLNYPAS